MRRCSCSAVSRPGWSTRATESSPAGRGQLRQLLGDHVEVPAAGQRDRLAQQRRRGRRDLAASTRSSSAMRPSSGRDGVGEQAGQLGLPVQDAAEAEQLVLDLVEPFALARPTRAPRCGPATPARSPGPPAATSGPRRPRRPPPARAGPAGCRAGARPGPCAPPRTPPGRPGAGAAWSRPTAAGPPRTAGPPAGRGPAAPTCPMNTSSRALRSASDSRLAAWRASAISPPRPWRQARCPGGRRARRARRGRRRRCRAGGRRPASDVPMMRSASCTDRPPISPRSWRTACSRCAASCSSPRWRMRSASCSACSRSSARIRLPSARASSRMRAASARRPASCSSYCRLSAAACSWASSARFSPPSILSVRSA